MNTTATIETAGERIDRVAAELGLTMTAEFVPFSKSRNKKEKHRSLNWLVTLRRGSCDILTTDYMQGSAHCPAYKASVRALGERNSVMRDSALRHECETGTQARMLENMGMPINGAKLPAPELRDVLHSLALDADVIDCATFEEWASNYGYETDSRSAEKIYRGCLEIALKLRAAIGDEGLSKLREAGQDY